MDDAYARANRAVWDAWTTQHVASDHHRDLAVVRAGGSSLRSIELDLLGDVSGKSLLHLQCNMGSDTLSWARRGARVTGVDFSDAAIQVARATARELGIAARFLSTDVLALPQALDEQFDLVVSTYGTICFLPDPYAWARVVARYVRPGGALLLIETHPLSALFASPDDGANDSALSLQRSYATQEAPTTERVPMHGGEPDAPLHTWSHPLGEVVTAIAGAGLHVSSLREYPYTFWRQFPRLTQDADGWWRWPAGAPSIPLLYSVYATRDGDVP